jgi:hypothetical protein
VVLALVLAACSPTTATTTTVPPAVPTSSVSTTTTTVVDADVDVCLRGDLAFGSSGLIGAVGDDEGDATQITGIRWDGAPNCERITIGFTNDNGAPATTLGPTAVSIIAFAGIVRVVFPPETTATAVADTLFDGDLVDRAFVVRGLADGLTLDIQAAVGVPVRARAFTTTSPSTLVIDIARGPDGAERAGISSSQTAVVITPVRGPNLYPLTVEGYAAPGLRAVHLIIGTNEDDTLDRAIALEGRPDAWQAIRTDLPDGPSGHTTLFVGTVDTAGLPIDGAFVSLDMP